MIYFSLAAGGFGILLLVGRYLVESNTRDMGTMSRQWLAEYNQSHPVAPRLSCRCAPRCHTRACC